MVMFNNIQVIGDSHVGAFYSYCRLCTLGPATMYSLTTEKLQDYIKYLLERNEIDKQSWWIFCVGEIDIRCLLFKQIYSYNQNEDMVICSLVDNYINNIQFLDHSKIAISSTVPPAKTKGFETQQQNTINSKYPFIGSDEDRNRWAIKLNTYLGQQCAKKNIHHIDIYNLFKNKEGFLDEQYIDQDTIHVKKNNTILPLLQNLEKEPL